jgi:hypothetical protein
MAAPKNIERILGAIIFQGDKAWFVKAAGSQPAFAEHVDGLLQVIMSIRFATDGTPSWTLPPGWNELPESGFRFRTLVPAGSHALDISVSMLPKNEADDPFILSNVNRWRGQVNLPPTDMETLRPTLQTVDLADHRKATIVKLDAPAAETPLALAKYDAPKGWTDRGPSNLRKADLVLTEGDKQVELAISSFSAAKQEMSNPIANINRWRRQIGLSPIAPEQLVKNATPTKIGAYTGLYVEMFAPDEATAKQATLVAMFLAGGDVWFVKLSGDGELAKRERDAFKQFLASIQLAPAQGEPQGATDGK